jgi:hypothetical protein
MTDFSRKTLHIVIGMAQLNPHLIEELKFGCGCEPYPMENKIKSLYFTELLDVKLQ